MEVFLEKRGLTRDQANYVMAMIAFRQELGRLKRVTKDIHVRICIDDMLANLAIDVEEMYGTQDDKRSL